MAAPFGRAAGGLLSRTRTSTAAGGIFLFLVVLRACTICRHLGLLLASSSSGSGAGNFGSGNGDVGVGAVFGAFGGGTAGTTTAASPAGWAGERPPFPSLLPPALLRWKEEGGEGASNATAAGNGDDENGVDTKKRDDAGEDEQECSCVSVRGSAPRRKDASGVPCCGRYWHTMHKMGFALSQGDSLMLGPYFNGMDRGNELVTRTWPALVKRENWDFSDHRAKARDFRDVFVFRNVYASLASGAFPFLEYRFVSSLFPTRAHTNFAHLAAFLFFCCCCCRL